MAEDIEDSVGGRSPYDKLLVTHSLHVVKSFGGKETHIAVRTSPQRLERSLILGLWLMKLAQTTSWQRGTRLLLVLSQSAQCRYRCNYMNNAYIFIKGHGGKIDPLMTQLFRPLMIYSPKPRRNLNKRSGARVDLFIPLPQSDCVTNQ